MSSILNTAEEIIQSLNKVTEEKVKVAFFGQPGAGKSSLINELIGEDVAEASGRTDTTIKNEPYIWNNLILMDLPGYGTEMFPEDTYWDKFNLDNYDLFICVFAGKLLSTDKELFTKLKIKNKNCIFVRNQVDSLYSKNKSMVQLKDEIKLDVINQLNCEVEIIFTSCRTGEGIEELSNKISSQLNQTKQDTWYRNANTSSLDFLDKKRKACEKQVFLASALSAVNGVNPIIGTDVAIDIGILLKLSKDLQKTFGINEEQLRRLGEGDNTHTERAKYIAPIASNVLKYLTKEGITLLIKVSMKSVITKPLVKFIPFIGPAISASVNYKLTSHFGKQMLEDYYEIAKFILEEKLVYN